MSSKPIPVNVPLLDGNEKKYLLQCVEDGWISSEGPFVTEFEQRFAEVVGRRYGIACANGSAAIDIAVAALGLGPGDEVIMPTFTIISPAASVVRAGATPVLVDSNPETWNMDVSAVEAKITSRTRAILVVHIYGLPCDMEPICELAAKYHLKIIEDAAEMHGQNCYGKPCGSFGDISTFSFYPNKHITTGEGGMCVVNDPVLAEDCRELRNLCFMPGRRFVHKRLGWNYRMTNLQAALGLAQLENLPNHVQRKREIGRLYQQQLAGLPDIQLPLETTKYADNIYWVFGLVVDDKARRSVDQIVSHLSEHEIGTRPFFWPIHEQPVFKDCQWNTGHSMPVSQRMARQGFYLPSGLGVTDDEISIVCNVLRNYVLG